MTRSDPQGRVLVVVPALNEEASITAVVTEILAAVPDAHVLVVDDGSSDRTGPLAAQAGAIVARLPYTLGVGGAMRLGFRYALERNYDIVAQIDGDGQHDPGYVPRLLVRLGEGAHMVIGARFAGLGTYHVRGPRRWAMALLSVVLSRMAGTRLTDTTSGMRVVGRELIEVFARHYPVDYLGDTVETLVFAARRGYRIEQEPVVMRTRSAGTPTYAPVKAAIYLGRAFVVLILSLIRQ